MHTFSKDVNSKNFVNLIGVSAELTSASSFFLEKALVGAVKDTAIKTFSKVGAYGNLIGAGVTVIMCTWDACISFDARDKDAGLAWAGAAAAFAVVAVEAGVMLAGGAAFGPIGWAAAGVGTIFVFLAYYLKDTPLEEFFKNNALSDDEDFIREKGVGVGNYNKLFYSKRDEICTDSDYQEWNNFKLAGAYLTDLMVASGIYFTAKKLINIKKHTEGWITAPDFITTGFIKQMEFCICFRQFLKSVDQLAFDIYFFKDGFNSEPEKITKELNPILELKKGTENAPPQISLDIEVPKKYTDLYTNKSILLIVSALSIGEGEFYPTSYTDETRLLGSYVSVVHTETEKIRRYGRSTEISLPQSNVAIASLSKLLSGEAWKK